MRNTFELHYPKPYHANEFHYAQQIRDRLEKHPELFNLFN